MGSVQTKDIIAPTTTPVKIQSQIAEHSLISHLQKTISASHEDPRSPGGRRTPVQSPLSTPNLNKNAREKMMMKYKASKSADPRSPSMASRTPLHLSTAEDAPRTPPPFRGCDPRSPYMMRTPLALSAQELIVVPDDLAIVGQEIEGEPIKFADEVIEAKGGVEVPIGASVEIIAISTSADSFAPNSPQLNTSTTGVSEGIMALVMSPLNSPMGSRKRKDIGRTQALSPLKKSYSAPMDENTPPSPVNKSIASVARARTPLSPLSHRAINTRQHSVAVHPIKFRMDPGILG